MLSAAQHIQLDGKLNAAIASLDAKDSSGAIAHLERFIADVDALVREKSAGAKASGGRGTLCYRKVEQRRQQRSPGGFAVVEKVLLAAAYPRRAPKHRSHIIWIRPRR